MKVQKCVALTLCGLATVQLSAAAQPPDSLLDAVHREAVVLAATAQAPAADDRAWQRVRRLEAGTTIILVAVGRAPAIRRVVGASDSELILLDVTPSVERIPRSDVVQITIAPHKRNLGGCVAAGYAGFALGGFVGGFAGGAIGGAVSKNSDSGFMRGMGIGLLAGGTEGAAWLFRSCRYAGGDVVYQLRST